MLYSLFVMLEEIAKISLLYDFYGALLPERKREVLELYYGEDLSLSEISSSLGITRQGVHDALRKGEKALYSFEEKLGLVALFERKKAAAGRIESLIDELEAGDADSGKLEEIRRLTEEIQD